MSTTSINVLFKRGPQANLPTTASDVVVGAFYLTTDTDRLYIGQQDGNSKKLQLLNRVIQPVQSLAELTSMAGSWSDTEKNDHKNDFYYIPDGLGDGTNTHNGNILVTWNGSTWVQINPDTDTKVSSHSMSVSANNNTANVYDVVTNMPGNVSYTANFAIQGSGGITVTANGSVISLNETPYAITTSLPTNSDTATFTLSNGSSTSSFSLIAGSNVILESAGNNAVAIRAVGEGIKTATLSATGTGAIGLDIMSGEDNHHTTAVVSNLGIVSESGSYYIPLVDTTNGATAPRTLDSVYSKTEIDNLIKDLNAMRFMGTVAPAQDIISTYNKLPYQDVQQGDVYVVAQTGESLTNFIDSNSSASIANLFNTISPTTVIGDMFIASGTEVNGVIPDASLKWVYVPAGNDALENASIQGWANTNDNKFELKNANGSHTFLSYQLVGTSGVQVSSVSTTSNMMVTTVTHTPYSTPTATTATAGSNSSFEAITGLTVDNGHITGYTSETFTPLSYIFSSTTASTNVVNSAITNGNRFSTTTTNDLSIATTLMTTPGGNKVSSSVIKLSSNNITLSKGSEGEVVMNLEWDTF